MKVINTAYKVDEKFFDTLNEAEKYVNKMNIKKEEEITDIISYLCDKDFKFKKEYENIAFSDFEKLHVAVDEIVSKIEKCSEDLNYHFNYAHLYNFIFSNFEIEAAIRYVKSKDLFLNIGDDEICEIYKNIETDDWTSSRFSGYNKIINFTSFIRVLEIK